MRRPCPETKENILQEAYRLFLTENLERVTIRDIENATKRTRGALFHYFKDKQCLFDTIVEDIYFAQIKKSTDTINTPIDFECFVNEYKNPTEKVIAHIKQIDENLNAEKAFLHFTLQANMYYSNFDTVYNEIMEKEYARLSSLLSGAIHYPSNVDINTMTYLLINGDSNNLFLNAFSAFKPQKCILKLLLQK